jgi:hypothetical protein
MLQSIDQQIIKQFNTKNKSWTLPVKKVYSSALMRKSNDHEFYLKLKLLQDKEDKILTTITNADRTPADADDILYGKYTDQYIALAFVFYNDTGIQPIWQAHQIVISEYERIFLSQCLLDTITPPVITYIPPPPQVANFTRAIPPPPPLAGPIRHFVQPADLANIKSKLKNIIPVVDHHKENTLLINIDDLLKCRDKLRKINPP